MALTLDYNHLKITIDDYSGRFSAEVGDLTVEDETLKGVKAKIDDAQRRAVKKDSSLPFLTIQADYNSFINTGKEAKVLEVVFKGIHRTLREFQTVPPTGHRNGFRHFAANTPKNRAIFEAYLLAARAYHASIKRMEQVEIKLEGYGRIDADEYPALLSKVERAYEKSIKMGEAVS
jgi:hypothetical protein